MMKKRFILPIVHGVVMFRDICIIILIDTPCEYVWKFHTMNRHCIRENERIIKNRKKSKFQKIKKLKVKKYWTWLIKSKYLHEQNQFHTRMLTMARNKLRVSLMMRRRGCGRMSAVRPDEKYKAKTRTQTYRTGEWSVIKLSIGFIYPILRDKKRSRYYNKNLLWRSNLT